MYVQVINISSSTTNSLSHRLSSHFFFSFLSGINTCRLHVSPPLAWTVHYVHYQSNLTDNQGSVSSSRCYSRCCSLCAKCQSTFTHSCIRRETYKLVHTQRLNLWYLIRSLCVCSCVVTDECREQTCSSCLADVVGSRCRPHGRAARESYKTRCRISKNSQNVIDDKQPSLRWRVG